MSALLEVDRLRRNFGGVQAVRDVSFGVGTGEIVGLIGPNGAGKSTIFSLIGGTLAPSRGDVVFKGVTTTRLRPNRIVRMGLVRTFQSTMIYHRATVLENLRRGGFLRAHRRFWPSLLRAPAAGPAEQARIADVLELLSLTAFADRVAGTLPYGLQRRLGIAIALASEPELLLLDEPAAGFNEVEADDLGDRLLRIRAERGVTLLLVEHHMRFIMRVCDRILVLDHGALIAQGTPAEIRSDRRVIEAYLGAEETALHA